MAIGICDQIDCTETGPTVVEAGNQFTRVCHSHTKTAIKLLKGMHPGKRVTLHERDYDGLIEEWLIARGAQSLTDPRPAPTRATPSGRRRLGHH
ncbi:hypothetical protein FF36_00163 [Frankia torreyi]|uniref:Uncharacterized protein n=1 Tax=Frankia torreyi TaxID=1856 RepID=A0A0D8BQ74_9ACTN|nr:hypothetical protein [Frankia torreyi]KJE25547.1 hypothetical protein FF36_00163 [Frankia torreyi]